MCFLKELFEYMMNRKKWRLVPVILVFVAVGFLVIFSETSTVVPFIYALF